MCENMFKSGTILKYLYLESQRTDAGSYNSICLLVSPSSCQELAIVMLGFSSEFLGVNHTKVFIQMSLTNAV